MLDETTATIPSATDLRQTGALQQRSLSLPFSRIVLNPQDFMSGATEVEQNCASTLPLGIGYYGFDQAISLPLFLSLWAVEPGKAPSGSVHPPRTRSIDALSWVSREHAQLGSDEERLHVRMPPGSSEQLGSVVTSVGLDARTPVLRVAVRSVSGQWALHVHMRGAEPIMILPGAAMLGLHYLDLRSHFPQGLPAEADLVLSVIGPNASVTIDEFRFIPDQEEYRVGADVFSTDWSPGGLMMEADSARLHLRGIDTFADHDSVVRELELSAPLSTGTPLTVVGRHIQSPVHDAEAGTVTFSTGELSVSVAIVHGSTGIRYYRDESELVAGIDGEASPLGDVGVWAIPLAAGQTRFRIGIGCAPNDAGRAQALALAAVHVDASERMTHWHRSIDEFLARVPQPSDFGLRGAHHEGVTPAEVEEAYYRAFHGLLINLLPAQPETGFAYPTIATGKASMWNYGAPGARSAAAWETFLAIQFLGYTDSATAWGCFNGLMSLVDESGSLAGESLPSRKAQTAWVLYSITHDRDSLREGYASLRRLLLWQAERPRWIYGTYDNPGEQDAEFLSSLIIDLGFGVEIAEMLGEADDATLYAELAAKLRSDYAEHCFTGEQREAVQYWFPNNDASQRGGVRGGDLQVTMGLAVPDLAEWQVESLLSRFDGQFDSASQLGGFDYVKHPNTSYTVSGLIRHGRVVQAQTLANTLLRDVIRSGSFAECYDRGEDRPRPWGVRPSIFGMTQVIDVVWLNNGFRMDLGRPCVIALPGVDGGVRGISVGGVRLGLTVREGRALLTGLDTASASEASAFDIDPAGTELIGH